MKNPTEDEKGKIRITCSNVDCDFTVERDIPAMEEGTNTGESIINGNKFLVYIYVIPEYNLVIEKLFSIT